MVGDILQPTHLLFILVVALLVLGPKRLPEVGRSLGSGLRDFRAAISGESTSHDESMPYVETQPYENPNPVADSDPVAAPAFDPVAEPEPAAPVDDVSEHAHEPDASIETADDPHPGPAAGDDAQTSVLDPDPTTVLGHASGDDTEPGNSEPVARPDTSGFASALAATRQRPVATADPAAGEDPAPHE